MALTGYRKSPARRCGGIRTLALLAATDVAQAIFDDTGRVCTAIVPVEGSRFARYEFREDGAEFTERAVVDKGIASVVHEIVFTLDRTTESNAGPAADKLLQYAHTGLIALLQAANGETFLVGCSARFGTEYPLRLSANTGTTAARIEDAASETLTLRSDDGDKAAAFTGDFPALLFS